MKSGGLRADPMTRRLALAGLMVVAGAAAGCDRGPEATIREVLDGETFLTVDGAQITLAGGTATGDGNVRYELLLTAEGDLDFDSDADAAAVLVADQGRERFLTVHALLRDGDEIADVSARLIGDRIEVHRLDISEGLVRVDVTVRRQRDPVTVTPSVDLTRHFALTDRGLAPIVLTDVVDGEDPPAGGVEAGNGTTEAMPALYTREWELESFDSGDWSADLRAPDGPVTLRFLAELREAGSVTGQLAGFAGCNRIFGSFRTYEAEALRFFGLAATRKTCGEGAADFEQRFLEALRSVRAFQVAGDRLTLALAGGAIRFRAGGWLVPRAPGPSPRPPDASSPDASTM